MKKLAVAFALTAIGFAALGAAIYHAATTPWSITAAPAKQEVWNRVNVSDMTAAVAGSAGPGGHIKLHLEGIKAIPNIDNVQVGLMWTAESGKKGAAPVLMEAADWTLQSKGYTGDMVWDVTEALEPIFDMQQLSDMQVIYHVTPRNRGVVLNDDSLVIDWTYFEIFDAAGNPVPQVRKPKPPNTVEPVRQSTAQLPARTFST